MNGETRDTPQGTTSMTQRQQDWQWLDRAPTPDQARSEKQTEKQTQTTTETTTETTTHWECSAPDLLMAHLFSRHAETVRTNARHVELMRLHAPCVTCVYLKRGDCPRIVTTSAHKVSDMAVREAGLACPSNTHFTMFLHMDGWGSHLETVPLAKPIMFEGEPVDAVRMEDLAVGPLRKQPGALGECGQCGGSVIPPPLGHGRSCGRCNRVRYCCRACRLRHWPVHKRTCGKRVVPDAAPSAPPSPS